MNPRFKSPSPSTAISLLALFIALTGTAYAASLPRNSVGAKQLKKNAVISSKIRKNAVTGAKIKTSAISGSDVANDALKGDDVDESSLATVPGAVTAQNLNGATIAKIDYRAANGSAAAEFFSAGGIRLTADCVGGVIDISANTSSDNAILFWNVGTVGAPGVDQGNIFVTQDDTDFDATETIDLQNVDNINSAWLNDNIQVRFTYAAAAGANVSGAFSLIESPNLFGNGTQCAVLGNALIS